MGYSKQVYDRVWEMMERRKQTARNETLRRREEIHRLIPDIARLEQEMARQATTVTRTIIANPDNAEEKVARLAQENLKLQQQREELLLAKGYPADYLADQFTCPLCRDQGYVENKMCSCMAGLLRQESAAQLNRTSPIPNCTFEGFSLEYYPRQADDAGVSPREKMTDVYGFCRRWAEKFEPGCESLLMIGRTGLGKTHLSIAMATEITRRGLGVVYAPVQRMMDAMEAEQFSREPAAREDLAATAAAYYDCDLLILDDLGTEFATQFTNAALYDVINSRMAGEKTTIINTNLELPDIEGRYTQRMVSRLVCGYKVLRFVGKDIRYQKKVDGSRR